MIIPFFLSTIFQILYNISLTLGIKNLNIIFIFLSIIFLSLFLSFLEKIKNIKLKLLNFFIQIAFSIVINLYLSVFLVPIFLALFKDIKSSINISKIVLFIIFLSIPFIYPPIQEIIVEKSLTVFEPEIKKIINDQIKTNLRADIEYVKSVSLFGFNFAINNLNVENKMEIEIVKNNMLEQIEKQAKYFEDLYIQKYSENIFLSLKNVVERYKLIISIITFLFLYYILNIYFLFVTIFYEIFKKTIVKYL